MAANLVFSDVEKSSVDKPLPVTLSTFESTAVCNPASTVSALFFSVAIAEAFAPSAFVALVTSAAKASVLARIAVSASASF